MAVWHKTRTEIMRAKKEDPHADVTPLQRQFRTEWLEDYIGRYLETEPRLDDAQRLRIAKSILHGPTFDA